MKLHRELSYGRPMALLGEPSWLSFFLSGHHERITFLPKIRVNDYTPKKKNSGAPVGNGTTL